MTVYCFYDYISIDLLTLTHSLFSSCAIIDQVTSLDTEGDCLITHLPIIQHDQVQSTSWLTLTRDIHAHLAKHVQVSSQFFFHC